MVLNKVSNKCHVVLKLLQWNDSCDYFLTFYHQIYLQEN